MNISECSFVVCRCTILLTLCSQVPSTFLTPRKCGLFGVCCEGIPQQVNYLIDVGMSSSKGSSAVINYMHHFFTNHGVVETRVDLNCSCSGQNKNTFVLSYYAWRTMHILHHSLGGWYGAGGKLWLATTPDSVLQAAATVQAVPALQLNIIFIALYEVI